MKTMNLITVLALIGGLVMTMTSCDKEDTAVTPDLQFDTSREIDTRIHLRDDGDKLVKFAAFTRMRMEVQKDFEVRDGAQVILIGRGSGYDTEIGRCIAKLSLVVNNSSGEATGQIEYNFPAAEVNLTWKLDGTLATWKYAEYSTLDAQIAEDVVKVSTIEIDSRPGKATLYGNVFHDMHNEKVFYTNILLDGVLTR